MNHLKWEERPVKWEERPVQKKVRCVHNQAKKFQVSSMLTKDKEYDVVNETDEFIFIIDNSGRVGGYYKEYFATNG